VSDTVQVNLDGQGYSTKFKVTKVKCC